MRIPRLRSPTFRAQIVASTMAVTALAMVLMTLGLQLLLHQLVTRNVDRVLEDRADSVVGAIGASSDEGLVVPVGVLDPGVVVFDDQGKKVAGVSAPHLNELVQDLSGASSIRIVDAGDSDRLLARPFVARPGVRAVVVVSEPLKPYERSELYVLLASIFVGLVVVLVVGGVARWVTSRALAPVGLMAERAREWSEHDLGRRFELGEPTHEISALGATLDGLLERVAMTIRAEQRLTAELAHELRTPLSAIQGSADLALLRGGLTGEARVDLEQIATSSRVMAETITTLLDLARDPASGHASATSQLADVVAAVLPLVPEDMTLRDHTSAADVRIAAPTDLVVRALSPVVENAVRHAASVVTLDAVLAAAFVEIVVTDDGAGIEDGVRDQLFAAGVAGTSGGTGLGLGIARRVARSIGGDVVVGDPVGDPVAGGGGTGAVFVVRLPRL
ncbi:MAG: putative Integral rane sensor signal transduction histidine kinase [Nocardioides sp.]|nr:putative Integral rane sensor signal transduction histidine kinase [Nocardioides sp.]